MSASRQVGNSPSRQVSRSAGRQAGRSGGSAGRHVGKSAGRSAGRQFTRSATQQVGRSASRQVRRSPGRQVPGAVPAGPPPGAARRLRVEDGGGKEVGGPGPGAGTFPYFKYMVRRGYYSPRPRSQHSLCFPCLDYSNYFGSDYSNQFVSAGRGLKQGRALGARWEGGERATGGWGRGGRARDEVGIGLRGVPDRTGRPCSSEAHGTRGNLLLC